MTPKKREGDLRRDRGDDDPTQVLQIHAPIDPENEDSAAPTSDDTAEPPPRVTQATAATNIDAFDMAAGAMLGEYRIEQKIGEGGMGVVFAAVHPLIGKRAAIKVLRRELCEDPYTVERFQDEARVVNEIGHPNIVDIFAFGEMPGGRRYFVMEWLKGESLRERIARTRSSLSAVCGILRPLARALEAAHEKGIIHRDLKPDNVFLVETREGEPTVKLLDFGIAKLARNNEMRLERTATGTMVGTPMYIAPEQARGHSIDHRVDIYSLGAIAFELLTGRIPFVADNAMEMVAKHLMEAPPTVASVWPGVPPALDRIVTQMLSKNADERPSLGALCAVLDEVKTWDVTAPPGRVSNLSNNSVAASTPPPGQFVVRRKSGARSILIATAVVVVGVIVAIVIGASGGGSNVPKPPQLAVTAITDAATVATAAVHEADARPVPAMITPDAAAPAVIDAGVPPHDATARTTPSHPDPILHPPPRTGHLKIRLVGYTSAEVMVEGRPSTTMSSSVDLPMPLGEYQVRVRTPDGAIHAFPVTLNAKTQSVAKTIAQPQAVKPDPCNVPDDAIAPPGCFKDQKK